MKRSFKMKLFASVALAAMQTVAGAQQLPTGSSGIASRYPGDAGIASDPAVIFAEDFESYSTVSGLTAAGRWNNLFQVPNTRLSTESGNVFGGKTALEFTLPKTNGEISNELTKTLSPGEHTIFLRFYAKFSSGYNVVGSSHNGATIQASYWEGSGGGPGIPADGYNKFLLSFDAYRSSGSDANPGSLVGYIYHPDQRDIWGDIFFPTGRVLPFDRTPGNFGSTFVSRPEVIPQLARWYSYEVMVKANTPGQRDGRIAFWLDGALIADFPNLRLRDTTDLKIDRVGLSFHGNGGILATSKKWYDNVVISKSYIGPISSGSSPSTLSPPTNLRVIQ
jgi:hypothetical protein